MQRWKEAMERAHEEGEKMEIGKIKFGPKSTEKELLAGIKIENDRAADEFIRRRRKEYDDARDIRIQELEEEINQLKNKDALAQVCIDIKADNDRLRKALEDAWERMDRARKILHEQFGGNWELLDTTHERKALKGE